MRGEDGEFIKEQYELEYDASDVKEAIVLLDDVVKSNGCVKGTEAYNEIYDFYYSIIVQPKIDAYKRGDKYVREYNEQLIKNDMEAYKFQLDYFRDTMSEALKDQTNFNYNSRKKLYSKIKN